MTSQSGPFANLETNDIVAVVLSVFLPGVGHMILGQVVKGIVILAVSICTCVGYLASIVVAADALCVARMRKERPVDDWEFFPEHKRFLGI